MRLEHAGKTAGSLPGETPEQERAKAVIVTEVDRLRWRVWMRSTVKMNRLFGRN